MPRRFIAPPLCVILSLLLFGGFPCRSYGSLGDVDFAFRACLSDCSRTGCVDSYCIHGCTTSTTSTASTTSTSSTASTNGGDSPGSSVSSGGTESSGTDAPAHPADSASDTSSPPSDAQQDSTEQSPPSEPPNQTQGRISGASASAGAGAGAGGRAGAGGGAAVAEAEGAGERVVVSPWPLVALRWDCGSECKYQCMRHHAELRLAKETDPPVVKYYGKWPFVRVLGIQEPASVLFSLLNLLATLWGLRSFLLLIYVQLPRKPMGSKGPVYEYAGLFTLYGLAAANSWLWSMVFHARDTPVTERLDYFSAIGLLGYALILAIIRTASLRMEAARVMVAAPLIAFTATHILYLWFYQFDYGWNVVVCTVMGVLQLLLWAVWGAVVKHPAATKLWFVAAGTGLAMLLELFDFPPLWGVLDAHAAWHACTVPLTLFWWDFVCDDAMLRTLAIVNKSGRRSSSHYRAKKTD